MKLDGIFLRKNSQSFSSVAFTILSLNKKTPSAYNKNEQSENETAIFLLYFPSSFCRAPCVFGGASSEDRALYFLCQPAAGIHLPAPWGSDKDQHRAHFWGYTAAPPIQRLCHSTLGYSTSQISRRQPPLPQWISSQMYKLSSTSQDIDISILLYIT